MKVKILSRMFADELEKEINIFLVEISDKKIIDIKYQKSKGTDYSAMIIYSQEVTNETRKWEK